MDRRTFVKGTVLAIASGGWTHGGQTFDFEKNIVTDFGAPTNGTSDTSTAWNSFTSFLTGLPAGKSVRLTVPNHTYNFDSGGSACNLCEGVIGGLTVVINAPTGATLLANSGKSGWVIGINAPLNEGGAGVGNSFIQSVNVGATSVTLVNVAEHALYTIGQWILITGVDLQGFGSPPNLAYFEYRKITGINAGTGVIAIDTPLTNQYLSTWPLYNANGFNGGPAAIYPLDVTWDFNLTVNNITFSHSDQRYCKGKNITLNNCTSTSGAGIVPTIDQTIVFNNCTPTTGNVEVDKLIQSLTYNGCTASTMIFQSQGGGTNTFVTNCGFSVISGTPRNMTISGGTYGSIQVGSGFGFAQNLTINNAIVSSFNQDAGGAFVADPIAAGWVFSGNTITVPAAFEAVQGAIPTTNAATGSKYFFDGTKTNEDSTFTVTGLAQDGGGNTILTTTLPSGFPNVPGTGIGLLVQPPIWNGSGNSGCVEMLSLNNAGAQGLLLCSYSKVTYTKNTLVFGGGGHQFKQYGKLVAVNINVTTPYTGTQPTLVLTPLLSDILAPDHKSVSSYAPQVNLKQAGLRTITTSAVTTQSGDTGFTVPGNIWFAGNCGVNVSADVSGENAGPIVEIEIITDQTISIFPT